MAPTQWLSNLLTPERWPFLPHALASGITRAIAFDTTGIGRAVRQLSPFDRIREAVLPRSALLRSLDWRAPEPERNPESQRCARSTPSSGPS